MSGKTNGGAGGKLPGWVLSSTSFLSMQYRIPTIALDKYEIDVAVIALVPKELCEQHRVLPVSRIGASLVVAMVDPVDGVAIDTLSLHTGLKIEPVITTAAALVETITKYYG
jgi:type IV pilus assembly protein PilB